MEPLHIRTVIQTTLALPDGKGNAAPRVLTYEIADFTAEEFAKAHADIDAKRKEMTP